MLKEIRFKNYRGFEEHVIPLQPLTVIVGRNNAGKSTIVEALRLVALVVRRLKNLSFNLPPQWLTLPKLTRGVSPSLRNMEIDLKTVNYRYGNPPAEIIAIFANRASIRIYIGNNSIYAVTYDVDGRMLRNKGAVSSTDLPAVEILPQIGPLLKEERLLDPKDVEATISSSLASLHFRNQLHLYYERLPEFQRAVQATWPGLRVLSLEGRGRWPSEDNLALLVQDGDFSAEASWMGHGLQMWLQTMWFLVRAEGADVVILDEPDVYMHADLQRKLIRYVQGRFPQVIIATHSTEIIAEVEPEQILIVDRSKSRSNFASSLPAVQQLLEGVGSVHNLQLTRLWSARRFLLIEGDDLDLLKRFQDILFPRSAVPFDILPSMEINGWGGWNYVVGSSMFLENAGGEGITTYCILDADYHTREEIEARYNDARTRGVQLHIWNRKEIENYLLVPPAIQRIISASLPENARCPSIQEVADKLNELAFALRDEVFDNLASELHKRNRHWDTGTANKRAREIVNGAFATAEGRLSIISGKRALSLLTAWSKDSYNVSFSVVRLARELTKEEIAPEVQKVVSAIENNQELLS